MARTSLALLWFPRDVEMIYIQRGIPGLSIAFTEALINFQEGARMVRSVRNLTTNRGFKIYCYVLQSEIVHKLKGDGVTFGVEYCKQKTLYL